MKEIFFDLKRNGLLVLLKAIVIALLFFSLFNVISLSQDTDEAIVQGFENQSNFNRYTIIDSLTDPTSFSEFRASTEKIETVGAFYEALNSSEEFTFLSAFDQGVPIVNFKGNDEFMYGYGSGMPSQQEFEDPLGRTVLPIKSLQINSHVFDFNNIEISNGEEIAWEDIDYSSSTIPVLLGSSYLGIYGVGDVLEGWLYTKDSVFEVVGFLDKNTSIYYKDEPNYYLDDYLVIPYPDNLDPELFEDKNFYGILSFAMINGDILAPKNLTSQNVLVQLDLAKSISGFSDYSLINVSSYLVQLSMMRNLIVQNFELIASLQLFMTIIGLIIVFIIDKSLSNRRKSKMAIWALLGNDAAQLAKKCTSFWLFDYLLVLAFIITAFSFALNQSYVALFVTLGLLFCFAAIDILAQRFMLRKHDF